MKKLLFIFSILIFALRLSAQTNAPVRLALISESTDASAAADVLTAQLSGNQKIYLLERNEIEKVYREQGMSAANRDDLKLGRILGADGLLLLDVVRTPQATNLTARLIAVKPGVILTDGSFPWPLKDTAQWAESVSTYLNSFLPKLSLLVKDAIPISVVNLRSAISSADAVETERQLQLLAIQRLSREPQFFVLERQKMQLLTEEKDLKLDDSAFWNGSYLLEGVVDQNGYSKEAITINARLTPPKGGAPVQFEVSGSRTNLAEVINQLAVKVSEALKVKSTIPSWNASDEAAQYFDEANWAMRWKVYSEAQAAAESAWALGKRDLDCATVRVRAYMSVIETGEYTSIPFTNPNNLQQVTNAAWETAAPDRPWGLVLSEQVWHPNTSVTFVFAKKYPDPKNIDRAIRALEVYQEFSQTLQTVEPEADSAAYSLGIEDLTTVSKVLQYFHFVHSSQEPAAEKLAQLRSLARSVAGWISSSPSVRDTYWDRSPTATNDNSANTGAPQKIISREPSEFSREYFLHPFPINIFSCEVIWGCFWQEKPEDCVALYRELMNSPAFHIIHERLWFRDELMTPRLTAWNDEDRKRIPTVWNDFIQELKNSTNRLFQIEGMASTLNAEQLQDKDGEGWLTIEPTKNDQDFDKEIQYLKDQKPFGAWNEQKPINPVEFLAAFQFRDYSKYQAQKIKSLLDSYKMRLSMQAKSASGEGKTNILNGVSFVESLQTDVSRILSAPDPEVQAETNRRNLEAFEQQKQFLTNNQPFDPQKFVPLFLIDFKDYSKTQALEIQPLLAAYKAKLAGTWAVIGAMQVGQVEAKVDRALNVGAETKALQSSLAAFEQQKQFLTNNQPFDPQKFVPLFLIDFKDYSKTQALEIQPLLAAYKTKLAGPWAAIGAVQVSLAEANVVRILNPALKTVAVQNTNHAPIRVAPPKVIAHVAEKPPEIFTNILVVNNYLKIPKNRVAAPYIYSMVISSHRWSGGKLLFDLRYEGTETETFVAGEHAQGDFLAAIAIFDPANGTWQVVEYPGDIEFGNGGYSLDSSYELFQGNLYLSCSDPIHKYDFTTKQWQVLDFPGQKRSKLFAIDGHFYAANDENILEIIDGGKGTRLMASTRRRPTASALDSMDSLGSPIFFSSSNHQVCAIIGNTTIFSWDGKDWRKVLALDYSPWHQLSTPESFDEGFIFRASRSDYPSYQNDLWVVKKDLSSPEFWLRDEKVQPGAFYSGINKTNYPSLLPLMKSPEGDQLASSIAAMFKSNLYFLVDHSVATNISGLWTATEKDGYDAKLVCLRRDFQEPFVIPLKIDLEQSQPSIKFGFDKPSEQMSLVTGSTWMYFAGDNLYIGQAETLGIWVIPIADIEAAIEVQKQALLAKKQQEDEAKRQLQDKMLAKYDLNHNGVIDSDEKEAALDDPEYIESELDVIDANHNGWLDAPELGYFDANQNKNLEPKEQAGIEIAQHLLAERLFKKFAVSGDGWLDRPEFDDLVQSRTGPEMLIPFPDANHDGHIDLEELETFLNQQMRSALRLPGRRGMGFPPQMRMNPSQPIDRRQLFKAAVESYWQNPGGKPNE